MVVTDSLLCPVVRIKDEMESDTDTFDTQTDTSSCPSSPSPEIPPSNKCPSLPMDTVILVAKAKDGSKKSLVFRSLLRNRRAPGRIEKIRIIKTSPVTDIKHASLRTNLRQQLDRHQVYQQEQRDQQFSQSFKVNSHLSGSPGITIPRVVNAAQVPATVLQVKTQLQHPTKYHVQESQKRQVQHFLNNGHHGSHMPVQSLPVNPVSSVPTQQHNQYHMQTSSSAPKTILTNTFLGDPSEAEYNHSNFDLLGELQSGEPLELGSFLDDSDLIEINPTIGDTLRDDLSQTSLLQPYHRLDDDGISSCPTAAYSQQGVVSPGISMQDDMWRKDRIRKDNHNIIERRRRFNINDRIKELGGLLPKTIDPDLRQNKGTILKASVDYIKSLQEDQRRFRVVMEQKKKADNDLRKVLLRLNQLQFFMKSRGIETPLVNDVKLNSGLNNNMPTEHPSTLQISSQNSHIPSLNNPQSFTSLLAGDELMDECFPGCGDPMLLSDTFGMDNDEPSLFFGHFQS